MRCRIALLSLAALVLAGLPPLAAVADEPDGVGISQVANGGPRAGLDNFIELSNFSEEPVDVSGWQVFRCFGGGGLATSPQVPALDVVLEPGDTFLIGNQFFGGAVADATYTARNSLANGGFGVQLRDATGAVVDSVGVYPEGVDSPCIQGEALPNVLTFADAEAYHRVDFTGDNAADYEIAERDPQPFTEPDVMAICEVMGPGLRSPFAPPTGGGLGGTVTVTGIVYAAQEPARNDGVWIQDPDRPEVGCEGASDGIFLFMDSTHPFFDRYDQPAVGDEVIVTGRVSEFFNSSQINVNRPDLGNRLQSITRDNALPAPTVIDVDEARAQGPDQDFYASLHQMRVELVHGQTYVGTNKFGEAFLVPGEIDERIRRTDERFDLFALDDQNLPAGGVVNVWAFDEVFGAVGPFDFSFDNFKLVVEDVAAVEHTVNQQDRPRPIQAQPAGTLGLATWNIEDIFGDPAVIAEEEGIEVLAPSDLDEDGNPIAQPDDPGTGVVTPSLEERQRRRDMAALALVDHMNLPAVVGVQEIANETLLSQLADRINEELDARGLEGEYEAVLIPGNDERFIDVGYLVDVSRVEFDNVEQIDPDAPATAASPEEAQVTGRCAQGPDGALLHDRPPLRIDVTDPRSGETFTMVTVHNKSKFRGTEENEFFEPCRVDQTQSVLDYLEERGLTDNVVIAGDINAFRDSATLDFYKDRGFVNMVDLIPEDRRFTFVFGGRVQFLDHFIVSPDLVAGIDVVDSPKIVNDAPFPQEFEDATTGTGSSDHDPIIGYVVLRGVAAEADIDDVRGRAMTARQIVVPATVTDGFGDPVAGADLTVEVEDPRGEVLDAEAVERDEPGEYHLRFRAEVGGEHTVRVLAHGFVIGTATIDVEERRGRR